MAHEARVEKTTYCVTGTYRLLRSPLTQNEELCLTVSGIERCAPNHSFGPCIRDDYHLHFILSGKGILKIEDKTYNLHRGQTFIVPPEIEIYYCADSEDPWEYAWVSFTGFKAAWYLEKAGLSISTPFRDTYLNPEEFLIYIEKILAHHQLTAVNELLRTSQLYEILAVLIESRTLNLLDQHQKIEPDYSPDMYVDYAVEYIHNHYATARVSDIASYIGITRSYLAHIFKDRLHVSPQEYLLSYRLEQGSRLLRTTTLSVNEIAEKIGYSNPLTFSKMFKKVYGRSPLNYRQYMKT